MHLSQLFEARKNPESNPKISINQTLRDFLNGVLADKKTISGVPNAFVSFTSVDKLGINPKSRFDTPLGIYAYTIPYTLMLMGDDKPADRLPFAGGSEWANLFSVNGNIVNLTQMDDSEAMKYIDLIDDEWGYHFDAEKGVKLLQDIRNDAKYFMNKKGGGYGFWYYTRTLSDTLSKITGTSAPVMWNKVFRSVGVDGCIDLGKGIIHPNEPSQSVFFSLSVVTNLKRVANKYAKEDMDISKRWGEEHDAIAREAFPKFREMSAEEIVAEYGKTQDNHKLKQLRYLRDRKARMQLLNVNPGLIGWFESPTAIEQEFVLRKSPHQILNFPKDSEDQNAVANALAFHRQNGKDWLLNLVKRRKDDVNKWSEIVKIEMLKADPSMFFEFRYNSPAMKKAAVEAGLNPNAADKYTERMAKMRRQNVDISDDVPY